MKTIKFKVVPEIISAVFVLLFLYAALNKLLDFEKFQIQLGKSPMLNFIVHWVVWAVPITELLICLGLVVKRTQFIALYASFALMVMFTVYIVIILNFSSYIPCSCGGILQDMTWSQHLVFNVCFVVLAVIGILSYPDEHKDLISIRGKAENLSE